MTKHNLNILKYNPNAFLDYVKNKNMNELIDKINTGINNININECMLCKKLKEKMGKKSLGKQFKYCKNNI